MTLAVTCHAPTGSIRVTTATSAVDPDADGYQVTVSWGRTVPIHGNGEVLFNGVEAGVDMVVLQHMTPNCRPVEGATRFVSVPEGKTGTVAYDVVCEPPPLLLFEKPGPGGNTADIAVIRSSGTDERLLTTHPARDGDPAWSSDGTRIAFATDRDGDREIWVMNEDGSDPIRLTHDPETDHSPAWSADGTRIAEPAWSADGRHLVCAALDCDVLPDRCRPAGIRIIGADGTSLFDLVAAGRRPAWRQVSRMNGGTRLRASLWAGSWKTCGRFDTDRPLRPFDPATRSKAGALRWLAWLVPAFALHTGCTDDPAGPGSGPAPDFLETSVEEGPHNVLSLIVRLRVLHADSVAVRFQALDAGAHEEATTPAFGVRDDSVVVPVLGLQPGGTYTLQSVAWGPGGVAADAAFHAMTGPLPSDLRRFEAGGPDHPSPGYVVFASGDYGVVIDNSGRVVWYRRFPGGPGLNFMTQPTGHYVARPPRPDPADAEPWMELDAIGDVTRTFGCARGLRSRFHDMITRPDGSYWIMCDESRTMDLTADGGVAAARVTGTIVQHIAADGVLLFEWSPFDHFAITDLPAAERAGESVNWTHGNALDFDTDGGLLVSFRSLNEITKIDVSSGDVIWRMGGLRNEFAFLDTPVPAFARQHSVRVTGAGRLLLLDNTGDPQQSRAERFAIDAGHRSARMVQSIGAGSGIMTPIGGSVQDLPGGRVLVAFGLTGRVVEYDADGHVVWSIAGDAGYVFRAQRIRSLYAPGAEAAR